MRAEERENMRYARGADNPVEKEEEIMFSLLPEGEGKKLLDIGCGVGTIGLMLQKRGFDYVGIDISEVGVKRASEKGLRVFVSDVDGDGLQFPDSSFDVVWAGDVLEHVFDPIGMLSHISRILKPDGCLLLTAPNDFSLASRTHIFLTGRSVQSNTYRTVLVCKHHTAFSW
jgi:2-polyprenyl-3-methyl-5-hydroxy-6-metoxy-1,4-benzoquinol methylase